MHRNAFPGLLMMLPLTLLPFNGSSQKIASLEVTIPLKENGTYIPVSVNLDEITYLSDTLLTLYQVRDNSKINIPFQVEQGDPRMIYWIIKYEKGSSGVLLFELVKERSVHADEVIASDNGGTLLIHYGKQNLLQYNYTTSYPPSGVDTIYKRSGFIHPLWAPGGQILTRIQPPDHYHHYGIWNPWTHVLYEGDTIDFWNLNSNQGTVRFAKFISVENGTVFSEFKALHEHVVLRKDSGEMVAMNELHCVRVYKPDKVENNFIVEFTFQLNCSGESPVKLLEYRYAGLGWRTTGKWDRNNSLVLTSEGKTRKDADGSRARWCIVQGEIDNDYAGVEMMSYPTNYNFPEPLRIWPEDQNNRGDMFANFCPTKNMDWTLYPRRNYVLKYRFMVYNGPLDKDEAESAWINYAYPPEIIIKKY